jgi:hypothetical protein
MEPRTQSTPSPEMGAYQAPEAPVQSSGGEARQAPERQAKGPETGELAPQAGNGGPTSMAALPQLPTLPAPQTTPPALQVPAKGATPLTASDEDLIEKEWVDKAKKIVAQTKDDPYAQEKEVSKLQADYLKKRYGKEIKLSPE